VAFAVSFGCCAVVFIFFPRFNFRGFRGQFLEPGPPLGVYEPGRFGEGRNHPRRSNGGPQGRDRSQRPAPLDGIPQGAVLDDFDGKIWSRSKKARENIFYGARNLRDHSGP